MKKQTCQTYKSEIISRFVDNELSCDEQAAVKNHMEHCPACRTTADQYESISKIFKEHTSRQVSSMQTDILTQNVISHLPDKEKNWQSMISGWFGKAIAFKLAGLAMVMVIGFFAFHNSFSTPSGPSAIVKSVDTDFSSVMIIETQNKKHTIIWFSET